MKPLQPLAIADVASNSPKYPASEGDVVPNIIISPGFICSIATCTIQLSAGAANIVIADPAILFPGITGEI